MTNVQRTEDETTKSTQAYGSPFTAHASPYESSPSEPPDSANYNVDQNYRGQRFVNLDAPNSLDPGDQVCSSQVSVLQPKLIGGTSHQ